jgi:hypothetical protein
VTEVFHRFRVVALFGATLYAASCAESSPVEPTAELTTGAVRYELVAGDQQSAPAGSELPSPLVVRVTDAAGAAVAGQIVNWVITEGSGSVFAGTAVTDDQGMAREWWTLGTAAGENALEVRAVDSATGEPLVFGRFQATGVDSTATELPPPAPSAISVSARPYKVKGQQKVDLGWAGAAGATVDIVRDGSPLVSTANDGSHLDEIDRKGSGSYRYRVCEAGSSVCSAEVQVNF